MASGWLTHTLICVPGAGMRMEWMGVLGKGPGAETVVDSCKCPCKWLSLGGGGSYALLHSVPVFPGKPHPDSACTCSVSQVAAVHWDVVDQFLRWDWRTIISRYGSPILLSLLGSGSSGKENISWYLHRWNALKLCSNESSSLCKSLMVISESGAGFFVRFKWEHVTVVTPVLASNTISKPNVGDCQFRIL